MHGLGADASDMMGVAEQLHVTSEIHHIFLDAPRRPVTLNAGMVMPAWYDIQGLKLTDREDKEGIAHSAAQIRQVIEEQLQQGFIAQHIYLAGFSQGGAMALHTALHYDGRLGGVMALSAYLPLAQETQSVLDRNTPFFLGSGRFDPLVLPAWTEQSKEWLQAHDYKHVSSHLYPMEHSICIEELTDMSDWLNTQIQGV